MKLFYSYSHKDSKYREAMERSLAQLKREALLQDWSDQAILPGHSISAQVEHHLTSSDVIVFLLSQEFIASDECAKEWERAKTIAAGRTDVVRIPIVLEPCAWLPFLQGEDLKALPTDGKPVSSFRPHSVAWDQVYHGIADVLNALRNTFTVDPSFIEETKRTDFYSDRRIELPEIFIFPRLFTSPSDQPRTSLSNRPLVTRSDLLNNTHTLIHGDNSSGKTALATHLFLYLVDQAQPVLFLDLEQVSRRPSPNLWQATYESQFRGDFGRWLAHENKTLVLDNLTHNTDLDTILDTARDLFDRIIITTPSTVFHSYLRDDPRLADFTELEIGQLTRRQQERLVRKRLDLVADSEGNADGYVDKIEERIDSIVTDHRLVPRYPFFVLSIMQTLESYMPRDMEITSYGHCYYALIVASLVRAGISQKDADINVCLNFAEHLAFAVHQHRERHLSDSFPFNTFLQTYQKEYVLPHSVVGRLKDPDFGLLRSDGSFRTDYMYHFFLGRYLANGDNTTRTVLETMCEETHIRKNYLTLLFASYHTKNDFIVDEILSRSASALIGHPEAKLDRIETTRLQEVVSTLPRSILSQESVAEQRGRERDARDQADDLRHGNVDEPKADSDSDTEVFKIMKNNEIVGQILRNKYGSFTRSKLEDIVETMIAASFRSISVGVNDVQKLEEVIQFATQKVKAEERAREGKDVGVRGGRPRGGRGDEFDRVQKLVRIVMFLWYVVNVEHVVRAISVPEILQEVRNVAERGSTPAYDLVKYFSMLHTAEELTDKEKDELVSLLDRNRDEVVSGLLSLRTQVYMNTHRSNRSVEQAMCAALGIKYVHRMVEE